MTVLKDFVQQIGKDKVKVKSLLSGLESEHTYTSSPKDILAIHQADMLVKIGLGLDVWTDTLIENAQNPHLVTVITSTGIPLISNWLPHESSETLPKDIHRGNPHIWLDPDNAKVMIKHITEGLIKLDPDHRLFYLNNQEAYFNHLNKLQTSLIHQIKLLPTRKMITHHDAWPYFARRFGFTILGNIIVQVGAEPSARQITTLIKTIKQENIKVIVSEPQLNPRFPNILAEETSAQVVVLTPIPGMLVGAETYDSMIKYNVETLISALKDQP